VHEDDARATLDCERRYETDNKRPEGNKPNQHGQLTSPEPTTSNEENKQVSIPVSPVSPPHAVPCTGYPCRMPPYSHADIPFKSPHRNSGGPANRQVAWSVTNLSLSVSLYTMVTDSYQIQPSCERES